LGSRMIIDNLLGNIWFIGKSIEAFLSSYSYTAAKLLGKLQACCI